MTWERVRLDWVAREVRTTIDASALGPQVFHYSIPVLEETGDGLVEDSEAIGSGKLFLSGGEVLISKLNPRKARVAITEPHDVPTVCSTEFVAFEPAAIGRRFLYYLLSSEAVRSRLDGWVQSVTRSHQRVRPEDIAKMWIDYPPLPEQRAIADYLDAETARIDALIARKRRMLELLEERERCLFDSTLAATPDSAPRADSPWLVAFPASWPVMRLSLVARLLNGTTPSRDDPGYWDGDVPWLASTVAGNDIVTEPTAFVTQRALAECALAMAPAGSVLVALYGQGKTRGSCSLLAIDSTFNQALVAIVPLRGRLIASFLHLALRAAYDVLRNLAQGGQQANLNTEQLSAFRIPVPSIPEQEAIATAVRDRGRALVRASRKLQRSIDLLTEKRQALITAAVTGELAVPGAVA